MSHRFRFSILCFFAGVSLAFGEAGLPFAVGFFMLAVSFMRHRVDMFLIFGAVAFFGGFMWTQYCIHTHESVTAHFLFDERAEVQGVISRDVEQRVDAQRVTLGRLQINGQEAQGQIVLSLPVLPSVVVFDEIKITCTIRKPESIEDNGRIFYYQWFLAGQNVHATCSRPYAFTKLGAVDDIRAPLFAVKQQFLGSIKRIFPEPEGSLLTGILLGRASAQETSIRTSFSQTGLSHIVAVSGWNITMVIVLVEAGLLKVMKRRLALPLVLGCVLLYVLLVGAEGSVIRAAIMGALVVVGRAFGRQGDTMNILLCAAFVMIVIRPYWLLFDVGFQLSVLATVGLVVASTPLAERIQFLPSVFELRDTVAASIVAILFTLPISLWTFGTFPLFALLANILTVPLLPLASLFGGVAALLGLIHPMLGSAVGSIAQGMLFFVTRVAEGFAHVPHALVLVPGFSAWVLVVAMVVPVYAFQLLRWRRHA
ncbi:MAG: ComEC/Rec2 family competence protein [Patescibacteria group bacterium]|jgi:competence protein ComEC